MLNFQLDLYSDFLLNVTAYEALMCDCARKRMPYTEAFELVRSKFSDLTDEQFLELRYEFHECNCVRRGRSRNPAYYIECEAIRNMLYARQNPEFYKPKFIQMMGRGLRVNKKSSQWEDLIGKTMKVQISKPYDLPRSLISL